MLPLAISVKRTIKYKWADLFHRWHMGPWFQSSQLLSAYWRGNDPQQPGETQSILSNDPSFEQKGQSRDLKEMVLRARSATARAFSISVACRWKAMYCSHRMELFGELSTSLSKSSADSGCRLGSISASSMRDSSFSAFCFSNSLSFLLFFCCYARQNINE